MFTNFPQTYMKRKENNMTEPVIFHGFIDEGGILLDDDYNELRNEEGRAIHIPEKEWEYYKIVTERWC